MSTPIETVLAFCAAFSEDGGRPAVRRWFTSSTRWTNEGLAVTTGIDEATSFIDEAETSMGIATVHIDMLGSEIGRVMVVGIFEIEGDRIVAWRDYYDITVVQKFAAG
jgi:limonene-1,2-epoxide hydrolase